MLFNSTTLFFMALAYLVGSIPTGFIVGRLKGIQDIRQIGSGNSGATNVGRFLGPLYFFLVFLLDAGKAYLFLFIIRFYTSSESVILLCAAALLLGNAYSLFLGGNGGKGVATLFGIVAAFSHYLAVPFMMMWTFLAFVTGTAALASLGSVAFLSCLVWYLNTQLFFSCLCATLFIFWRHRTNLSSFFKKDLA